MVYVVILLKIEGCNMCLLRQGHHQSTEPDAKPRTFEVRRWGEGLPEGTAKEQLEVILLFSHAISTKKTSRLL